MTSRHFSRGAINGHASPQHSPVGTWTCGRGDRAVIPAHAPDRRPDCTRPRPPPDGCRRTRPARRATRPAAGPARLRPADRRPHRGLGRAHDTVRPGCPARAGCPRPARVLRRLVARPPSRRRPDRPWVSPTGRSGPHAPLAGRPRLPVRGVRGPPRVHPHGRRPARLRSPVPSTPVGRPGGLPIPPGAARRVVRRGRVRGRVAERPAVRQPPGADHRGGRVPPGPGGRWPGTTGCSRSSTTRPGSSGFPSRASPTCGTRRTG